MFTLNTSIMAVAEAALGRMGAEPAASATRPTTRGSSSTRKVWELPGAMPEIAPSPDFGRNIDQLFTERSMALQAWGTYGILWPVVHYQLGVSPDVGRDRFTVVPQIPSRAVQGRRPGHPDRRGLVNVTATRGNGRLVTTVQQDRRSALTDRRAAAGGREGLEGHPRRPPGVLPRGHHRAGP